MCSPMARESRTGGMRLPMALESRNALGTVEEGVAKVSADRVGEVRRGNGRAPVKGLFVLQASGQQAQSRGTRSRHGAYGRKEPIMIQTLLSLALVFLLAVYCPACPAQSVKSRPPHRSSSQPSSAPADVSRADVTPADSDKRESEAKPDDEKSPATSAPRGGTTAPVPEGSKRYLAPESK